MVREGPGPALAVRIRRKGPAEFFWRTSRGLWMDGFWPRAKKKVCHRWMDDGFWPRAKKKVCHIIWFLTNSIAAAASRRRCRRHRGCRCCCLRRRRCRRRWESKKRRQRRALGVEGRARVMRRAANGDDGPCIATKTWFQFSRSDGLWIHGLRKKKRCVFLRGADGWMDFGRAQKNNVRSADFFFAGPLIVWMRKITTPNHGVP